MNCEIINCAMDGVFCINDISKNMWPGLIAGGLIFFILMLILGIAISIGLIILAHVNAGRISSKRDEYEMIIDGDDEEKELINSDRRSEIKFILMVLLIVGSFITSLILFIIFHRMIKAKADGLVC